MMAMLPVPRDPIPLCCRFLMVVITFSHCLPVTQDAFCCSAAFLLSWQQTPISAQCLSAQDGRVDGLSFPIEFPLSTWISLVFIVCVSPDVPLNRGDPEKWDYMFHSLCPVTSSFLLSWTYLPLSRLCLQPQSSPHVSHRSFVPFSLPSTSGSSCSV